MKKQAGSNVGQNSSQRKKKNSIGAGMSRIPRSTVRGEKSLKWAGRTGRKPPSVGSIVILINVGIGKDFTFEESGDEY